MKTLVGSYYRLALCTLAALLAHAPLARAADPGVGAGGGGAQIESAYRLRAYDLINKIGNVPAADSLCSSDVMLSALESTKIRVVDQLIDLDTNLRIKDQKLDAWTTSHLSDMQLLGNKWDSFLNGNVTKFNGRSIDVLALHEVYRATRTCNDEGFAISDKIPGLLKMPTKYSRIFKFTYPSTGFAGMADCLQDAPQRADQGSGDPRSNS